MIHLDETSFAHFPSNPKPQPRCTDDDLGRNRSKGIQPQPKAQPKRANPDPRNGYRLLD